ncbi:hypothetical protein [Azospirillum thiophilum]|uniref:hypothetical protein n=1 Tax=Azospirillum thiophilum TaxID=528244 RepID=UPI00118755A9|nr:hypothetical protein [Azospirillum thiophilum]
MCTYNARKLQYLEGQHAAHAGKATGLSEKYRAIAFLRMEADKEYGEASACSYRSRDKALLAELGRKAGKLLQEESAVAEEVGTARQQADRLKQLVSRLNRTRKNEHIPAFFLG